MGACLLKAGFQVRCLARSPRKLGARPWSGDPRIEIAQVDLDDVQALSEALQGCQTAYYLIHSMRVAGPGYAEQDRRLARNFAEAAERAGVGRIIYLGGLGEVGDRLSKHLASRREVERLLGSGSVPVTVFRAAMIIGSGSASFEILRYLTERLPVMVTPRWVATECQPIAIDNILNYLVGCLSVPETVGATLDIGGPEILTYRQLIALMAKALGLRARVIIPVPVLTPRLSSFWIHLVTPISHRMARPLAEGLRNRVVCRDDRAARLMPQRLLSAEEAIHEAVRNVEADETESVGSWGGVILGDPDWAGGKVFVDEKWIHIRASAESVFHAVCRLGRRRGRYPADWLWRARAWLDHRVGGPGLRNEERPRLCLACGDALYFWRVVETTPVCSLRLRAEMKLPGEGTLEFLISPLRGVGDQGIHGCRLRQVVRFRPRGLAGLYYWYAVLPLHWLVFRKMLKAIRREAEASR